MDKRLYVAYGSNLNLRQMKYRCPTAKVYGKGVIKGYELLFKGHLNNAYLTIEAKPGGKVPVVVWEIQKEDEISLDRYEGYPMLYYKEDIPVELEEGKVVEAMTYIMTDIRGGLNPPSKYYLQAVSEGYDYFEFDKEYLTKALDVSKVRKK